MGVPDHARPEGHVRTALSGPVITWLSVQLIAILVSTARVPLAAKYPQPAELLAVHVMVIVQLTAAALLAPYLMRTRPAAVAVIVAAWPFTVIAGVLSAAEPGRLVAAGAWVSLWLLALAGWCWALPRRAQPVVVAVATLLALGPPVLWYLRAEFGGDADALGQSPTWTHFTPTAGALARLAGEGAWWAWSIPLLVCTLAVVTGFSLRRRDQVIHSS